MAVNWDILKARYLQASQSAQMDALVLNLIRLQVLAQDGTDELVAQHLVRESQFFIEWTVPGLNLESDITFAGDLVDLQRLLSRWKLGWSELWGDEQERRNIGAITKLWCDRLQGESEAIAS